MRSDHEDLARTRLDAIAHGGREIRRDEPDVWATDPTEDDDEHGGGARRIGVSERLAAARWDVGRRGMAAVAAVACTAALVAAVVAWRERAVPDPVPPLPSIATVDVAQQDVPSRDALPGGAASDAAAVPGAAPSVVAELVVSVVGLVARPGLVHLPPGSRVADALDAAGGTLDGADLLGLNLARRVADGDQIVVGVVAPEPEPPESGVSGDTGTDPGAGGSEPDPRSPLNLNTCDEADLDALPGVGPVTASAIVEWRRVNGPFTHVDQLAEVDGIGPARLARLRELVTV
ncbi:MAG: ComEA family DNA-binding protein [Rhodococcus sp.]|uniref:ComEA family DNA-binding protein n=1 Tax=Rhodococcus sp. TaxID=1831 RepID=UPI0016BABBCE|nr:ComEA family DNA-binding protein [Rhodococcus sp. (in: high G+C Gram-positive bacteria)]NLV79283.1 ComEA family DNA-binding protein [Rhodococcus sp. (in: high G+C Gram-positive bacteria)]